MPHLHVDGVVLVHLVLDDHKLARPDLLLESLIDVVLHDALAQLLAQGPELGIGVTCAGDAQAGLAAGRSMASI